MHIAHVDSGDCKVIELQRGAKKRGSVDRAHCERGYMRQNQLCVPKCRYNDLSVCVWKHTMLRSWAQKICPHGWIYSRRGGSQKTKKICACALSVPADAVLSPPASLFPPSFTCVLCALLGMSNGSASRWQKFAPVCFYFSSIECCAQPVDQSYLPGGTSLLSRSSFLGVMDVSPVIINDYTWLFLPLRFSLVPHCLVYGTLFFIHG